MITSDQIAASNRLLYSVLEGSYGDIVYFAQGSNMLLERLKARCPNAQPLGHAWVKQFRLSFSKKSNDGSGKATLIEAAGLGNEVHGALFRIPLNER